MSETDNFAGLVAAIDAGDEARCEELSHQLTPTDADNLITLAAAADPDQRWWAVRALALVGDGACVPALVRGTDDDDPGMRAAAAMALGYVHRRAPGAVAPQLDHVAMLLADDNGIVRQAAGDGLALCADDAVAPLARLLQQSDHQGARTRAAAALRKIATMRAAAILYPLLNDPNHLVRMYAYEGLDEMGLLENVLVVL